ncbi:MAG: serine hydrolase, partial [Syntrophomonadaceae bacterium]|nr:serine hydrolase [Syntrophomonadaceae bacterium]
MFKRTKYLTLVGFLIAFIFTLSTTAAFADNIQDTSLESFFDNTMKSKMEKYHIPNAAVSVVKDGEIVYK